MRFQLYLCYAAMATIAAAVNLMPVFLTRISADFGGLSAEQLGRIGAVTMGGLVTGIVLSGPLADRFGARGFAVGGNAVAAVGLAWLAIAPGYDGVIIASGLLGIGAGVLDMVLSPIVAALQPLRRQAAMNTLHSFFCTGAVVIITLGSLAIALNVNWRVLAAVLVVWPVGVGIGFARVRLPTFVAEGDVRTPLRYLLGRGAFWLSLAAILLGGSTEVGMAFWLPAYAEKTLGFSAVASGFGLMGFTLAMAVGRLGILALPGVRPVPLMLVCCGLSVLLFAAGAFVPHGGVALSACIAAGLTGSCLWPSVLAVTADKFPAGGATMFALLAATGNVGAMVMPWVIGGVADATGSMRVALAVAGLCPLVMIGVLLPMRERVAVPTV